MGESAGRLAAAGEETPVKPSDLEGTVLGPVRTRVDGERIAAFVRATGDDPRRWRDHAPPGYAARLLFAVAEGFLFDPRLVEHTRALLHVDQAFSHPAPFVRGDTVEVVGRVARVRERAGASLVTFECDARGSEGPVLSAVSTFLMSSRAAAEPPEDPGEPGVHERAPSDPAASVPFPGVGGAWSASRSASRADLIRYAAATGDLNPVHWDHEAARAAGLPGVVVHGLLLVAWLGQHAAAVAEGPAPVRHLKARFRAPMRPAEAARLHGDVQAEGDGEATVALTLRAGGRTLTTATATVRR